MYHYLNRTLTRYFKKSTLFKALFNLSPMYRRSTGRIRYVSDDLMTVKIEIPISYKNKNYVGTIFGGSLFSATDPIYMIQLIQLLGKEYVVWDKASTIRFRKPATKNTYAVFEFTADEIVKIQTDVAQQNEINIVKHLQLTDACQTVFAEVEKTIYVASKEYYKTKKQRQTERIVKSGK